MSTQIILGIKIKSNRAEKIIKRIIKTFPMKKKNNQIFFIIIPYYIDGRVIIIWRRRIILELKLRFIRHQNYRLYQIFRNRLE